MLEYPEWLRIPLAAWVDGAMDWVLDNLGGVFSIENRDEARQAGFNIVFEHEVRQGDPGLRPDAARVIGDLDRHRRAVQ